MLFTPALVTVAWAMARELRAPVDAGMRAGLWGIACAAAGAAMPILALAVYYAAHGALPALLHDLVSGLPQKFVWFDPYPIPTAQLLTALATVALSFAAVWLASRRLRLSATGVRYLVTAAGSLALAVLLALALPATRALVLASLGNPPWQALFLVVWYAVPFVAVWLTGVLLMRAAPSATSDVWSRQAAVLLVYCNAVTSILLMYPSADLVHVMMHLPAYAPLCAFLLERFHHAVAEERGRSPSARWLSGGLIGALALCMAVPSLDHLFSTWRHGRRDTTAVQRATAIRGAQPKFGEVAALLAYLDANVPAQRELLLLNGEQMLYFLAGRRSPLEKDEFTIYMVGADIISPDDARGLVDQNRAVARLAEAKPVVVEGGDRRTDGRVRKVFGELSRYIDAHYRVAATVANYRILTWAGE
jgi:hypothetical protein